MPKPPIPETKPAALRFSARDVKFFLSSPAFVLTALVLASAPGLVGALLPREPHNAEAPVPLPVPQVPLQETSPTATMPALAALLPGRLPSPGPNQLRAGKCEKRSAQVAINGGCWVKTDTPPPCPAGFQWEHEGACWLPAAPAQPPPTTGEPRPSGIADP